jgi:chromosomal replication initiator protein DnaA
VTADLHPRFRFDTFVVGSANRLAVSAAKSVAESPGVAYNPLFIYSGPGLGKTHLLMAVAHAARTINPKLQVEYLTLDDFMESFHAAVAAGQGEAYRRRFTEVDLLLVDDVQFLDRRREMQSELLRVINAMQTGNRQIVLTSDRGPGDIESLDERLIQRFAGGLVIDIAAPDYETRVAIVRRHAEERKATFAPGVLETVAKLAITNVRELIGALNRLIAFQAVSDQPLDEAQARVVLGGVQQQPERTGPDTDEFGSFLSEISHTVAQQVEAWRTRVAEAVLRWEGEGYRVSRLNALLEQETPPDPDLVLKQYAEDIERLRALESDAIDIDASLAAESVFRDPDRIAEAEALLARAREGATPPPGPSPFWQLTDFAEGPGNRIAVRAALMAVEHPALKYNPLVVIGPSGTGKTHLLHAVGNALVRQDNAVVACLSTQEFVDDLISAIDRDRVGWWRSRYRRITAFILDDIQLLGNKERTQEEFFWLFNHLIEEGRQMVFSSSVPLAELADVEPRLISRLEGGLVVHLPPPEREVRLAVLERLLRDSVGSVDPELAEYLAGRTVDSIRTMQGVLQRVLNAAETRHEAPTASLARELLEGVAPRPARKSGGHRVSGVIAQPSGMVRSREKMIWEWPEPGDRIIEDLR